MPEAYIEQSKTLDQDQPTWEIYPSCDVRMGEYFRKFPEAFARYVIDVNTDSIKDVLQTLDEDHSPRHSQQPTPLRFEVTPIETLQRKEGPLSHYMISGVYEDRVSRHW